MNDDIKSIMSSTSSNQERLKQAAKSPIAKRLHIIASNSNSPNNGGKYTIPIPFTLKLPPKLSSVNTTRETSAASSVVSSHMEAELDLPQDLWNLPDQTHHRKPNNQNWYSLEMGMKSGPVTGLR